MIAHANLLLSSLLLLAGPLSAAVSLADSPADPQDPHPLDRALEVAVETQQYLRTHVHDYTAVIIKRERIRGKLNPHEFMLAKIRNRRQQGETQVPFSVYLRFLKPSSLAGREVIWVEGRNRGRLVAHEKGIANLLRVNLKPTSRLAMLNQRYPITEIGIHNLIDKLIERGRRERRYEECQVKFFDRAKIGERECTMIEVTHPVRRAHFDFYRARIFIDKELKTPVRYAAWSWPPQAGGQPPLEEEYTYTQLKLNVGLTDRDFDPDNPQYDFP